MPPDRFLEFQHHGIVAGIDEVGRGSIAGPLVVACCVLPKEFNLSGINDSKKLSAKKREQLYNQIISTDDIVYTIVSIRPEIVDRINIFQATMFGMRRALEETCQRIDISHVLIDGNKIPRGLKIPATPVVKGDGKCLNIAAASILAKVWHDREMTRLNSIYPQFEMGTGYPTPAHKKAIKKYGLLDGIHRKSYAPCKFLTM
jgi:ribonuclease HII